MTQPPLKYIWLPVPRHEARGLCFREHLQIDTNLNVCCDRQEDRYKKMPQ